MVDTEKKLKISLIEVVKITYNTEFGDFRENYWTKIRMFDKL